MSSNIQTEAEPITVCTSGFEERRTACSKGLLRIAIKLKDTSSELNPRRKARLANMEEFSRFAEELADAAGDIIREYWRKPLDVEDKVELDRAIHTR